MCHVCQHSMHVTKLENSCPWGRRLMNFRTLIWNQQSSNGFLNLFTLLLQMGRKEPCEFSANDNRWQVMGNIEGQKGGWENTKRKATFCCDVLASTDLFMHCTDSEGAKTCWSTTKMSVTPCHWISDTNDSNNLCLDLLSVPQCHCQCEKWCQTRQVCKQRHTSFHAKSCWCPFFHTAAVQNTPFGEGIMLPLSPLLLACLPGHSLRCPTVTSFSPIRANNLHDDDQLWR